MAAEDAAVTCVFLLEVASCKSQKIEQVFRLKRGLRNTIGVCVCVCDKVERLQESAELAGDNAQGGGEETRLTVRLKDEKSAPTGDADGTHLHGPGSRPPCSEQK